MPREASKDASRKLIEDAIAKYYQQGLMTDCAVFTGYLGQPLSYLLIETKKPGNADPARVFDLASMTKALATTPLIHRYLTEVALPCSASLHETLGVVELPGYLQPLQFKELLSHHSGLPDWRNFWINRLTPEGTAAEYRRDALDHVAKVFSRYDASLIRDKVDLYSDLNFILLGYFLERKTGRTLEQNFAALLRALRLDPEKSPFYAASSLLSKANYIPTAHCALRGRLLRGEIHDENAAALGGLAGHAGLFGTIEQVMTYLEALATQEFGWRLLTSIKGDDVPLGWRRGDDEASRLFGAGRAIGHYGFTGTAFWLVPETKACVIVLTNRVISGRINPLIRLLRKEIFALADSYLKQVSNMR